MQPNPLCSPTADCSNTACSNTDLELTRVLADAQRQWRQPSLSAAVGRGSELMWSAVVGDPSGTGSDASTLDPAYRIGSITKPMVAVAVLQLVDAGEIALGDRIGRVLPDAPAADATIAQFLSHSSGLQAETNGPWWERSPGPSWPELVVMAPQQRLRPGRRFRYSNVGYAVLGHLLEVVHGRAWDDILAERVWQPLGMTRTSRLPRAGWAATGWAVHPYADLRHHEPVPDYRAMGPAGEVWSTPSDLVRFGQFLAGHSDLGGDVLSFDLRAQMREPLVIDDNPGLPWTSGYGLGLQVVNSNGTRYAGHTGSVPGFTADVRAVVSVPTRSASSGSSDGVTTGDVVAVCGSATRGFLASVPLLRRLTELEPVAAGPFSFEPDQADRVALTGVWFWGPTPLLLVATGDGLRLSFLEDPSRVTDFVPAGQGGHVAAEGMDRSPVWVGSEGGYWRGELLRIVNPTHLDLGSFALTRTPYDPDADIPGGTSPIGWH